jgi:hypothetical protein
MTSQDKAKTKTKSAFEELSFMLGINVGKYFYDHDLPNMEPQDAFRLGVLLERKSHTCGCDCHDKSFKLMLELGNSKKTK